jgi:hypothetical protein
LPRQSSAQARDLHFLLGHRSTFPGADLFGPCFTFVSRVKIP